MSQPSAAAISPASPRTNFAGEFYRGLTRPSWQALAICFGFNAVFFLLLSFLLTPDFMMRHGDRIFSWGSRDYDLFSTTQAFILSRESGAVPRVVIVGGSTTRASLPRDLLEDHLRSRLSPAPRIFKLNTDRQSLWESAAFLEMIPDGACGTAIIGVSPGQFIHGTADFIDDYKSGRLKSGRLGFRSKVIDRALGDSGLPQRSPIGIYWIDNASFFLARWKLPVRRILNPVRAVDANTLGLQRLTDEELRKHSQLVNERFNAVSPEAVEESFRFLREMIHEIRNRTSMSVLLVEAPVSSRFLKEFHREEMFRDLRKRTQRLAMEMGINYVDLNSALNLPDTAFYDWAHLSDRDTVVRCTQLVADRMVEMLPPTTLRRVSGDPPDETTRGRSE